jgi:hypothetical protein
MKKPPELPKPHKVGDIVNENDVELEVIRVSQGPLGYGHEMSAEPIAKRKGYITNDQIIGRRVEHDPPPFVPHGARRDPAALKESDWNFVELMRRPLKEKKVALFHELARESARVRMACARLEAGVSIENEWHAKKVKSWQSKEKAREELWLHPVVAEIQGISVRKGKTKQAEMLFDTLEGAKEWLHRESREAAGCPAVVVQEAVGHASKAASQNKLRLVSNAEAKKILLRFDEARDPLWRAIKESSEIARAACMREGHSEFEAANAFLSHLEKRFPYGVGEMMAWLVAKDVGWNKLSAEQRADVMKRQGECEAQRVKHEGRLNKDMPCDGPGWPYDDPIHFAGRHWQELKSEWPQYGYNDGKPGRMVLTRRGNGKDAPHVLSESLEICVCLNYRDEEILETFKAWLERRRKILHSDLEGFRVSSKRPYTKLKGNNVDAALKGLAALRLLAAMKPLEAASEFDRVYFPNVKNRKPDIGNLNKAACIAIEWQQMFFKYCPLDSAGPVNPEKGPWDRECSLCFKLEQFTKEPKPISKFHYLRRCPVCDHREELCWNGKTWVPYEPRPPQEL